MERERSSRSDRGVPLYPLAAVPRPHPSHSQPSPAQPNPANPNPKEIPSASRATPPRDGQLIKARCLRTAPPPIQPPAAAVRGSTTATRKSHPISRPWPSASRSTAARTERLHSTQQRPQKERERPEGRRRSGFPETPLSHTPVDPAHGRLCPSRPLRGTASASCLPRMQNKSSGLTAAVALRHRLCGHAVLLHPLGRRSQIHRARTLDGPGARPLAALRRDPHLLKPLPSCSCSRSCGSAQPKAGGARSRSSPPASLVPVWCF